MKIASRFVSTCLPLVLASLCHAQPVTSSAQSAKEQRQASTSKEKARPDRAQAETKKLKGAQKEARDRHDQKVKAAETEMSMGIASGTSQMGATGGAKKTEKLDLHNKDAIKKSR